MVTQKFRIFALALAISLLTFSTAIALGQDTTNAAGSRMPGRRDATRAETGFNAFGGIRNLGYSRLERVLKAVALLSLTGAFTPLFPRSGIAPPLTAGDASPRNKLPGPFTALRVGWF